jgi:hypothetical protein
MKALTRTLAAFLSSGALLMLSACSMNRADSLRMLDRRAEYDQAAIQNLPPNLKEGGLEGFRGSPVPVRTRGQVAAVYAYATEMSPTTYFWGGWFSLVIEEPQWVLAKPGTLPPAPGVVDAAFARGKKKRPGVRKNPQVPMAPASVPVNAPTPN